MTTTYLQGQIETVLFDLDGTVIDTNELILASFTHVLQEHLGLTVPREQLVRCFGEPLGTTLGRFAPPEQVPALVEAYRAYNRSQHDQLTRPIPGMREALALLQQAGCRLAVTTSKRVDMARRGLALFDLEPFFEVVVGWDDTERHKPHPDPVLCTLERLGVAPGPQVLMVGDSPLDLASGRAAGVRTAAVGWSQLPEQELAAQSPDLWIQAPADLVRLCSGSAPRFPRDG